MTEKWLEVASRQAGAISSAQMRESGVSVSRQRGMVRHQILERAGRGVYVHAGSARDWKCSLWVELLLAGPGAFACRRTAAALWDLDGVERRSPKFGVGGDGIDIGVAAEKRPRRPRTARLSVHPGEVTSLGGVPLTEPGRTLLDLGSVVDESIVERSLESALRRRLIPLDSLPELARRAKAQRMPGGRRLYRVLRDRPPGVAPTESDAETLFVQLVRNAGYPAPDRQTVVILRGRKYRLDFAWRRLRLAVEVDSASVHTPDRLTADLHRQNLILLDGWLVLRFTWYQLTHQTGIVARDLREAWELRALQVASG